MARLFDDGSSEYLEIDQAVATAVPLTMAAWFNSDSITVSQYLIYISDKDVANQALALSVAGATAGDPVRAVSYATDFSAAATSSGYSADTWHHACAVFATGSSRSAYIDGGSKGTNGTGSVPANLDRTSIGRAGDSTPGYYMSGSIAEAAIWNVALTDAEVALLAKGFSPLFFHPQNLLAYWSLFRDEDQDRVGGYDMTAYNIPTISVHPPKIIYPAPPFLSFPVAAAGVNITVPVAALTLTGYAPTVATPVNVEVPVAALTLTGYAPTVGIGVNITVPVAALAFTGYAPTVAVTNNIDIEVPVASLTMTGYAPTVDVPVDVTVPVAALTLTGYAPTVGTGVTVEVPVAALALTGYAPVVTTTAHVDIEIPVAALMLTGYAPTVVGVGVGRGPDPVWDRYKRDDFPELPHIPKRQKSAQEEITERWNKERREHEKQEALKAEAATLDEMAVERVDVYLEEEEAAKIQAGTRRRQSMINLEKGKIMGEHAARKQEEVNKVRRKNLQKARRKLRRKKR